MRAVVSDIKVPRTCTTGCQTVFICATAVVWYIFMANVDVKNVSSKVVCFCEKIDYKERLYRLVTSNTVLTANRNNT